MKPLLLQYTHNRADKETPPSLKLHWGSCHTAWGQGTYQKSQPGYITHELVLLDHHGKRPSPVLKQVSHGLPVYCENFLVKHYQALV